ncbi:MAG: anthranilate phosphoribosyltransferase [Phycisphaerales bacterium]|nr:anthranilate phosphoribosyltransferase [Phycisphaerales bacterium]
MDFNQTIQHLLTLAPMSQAQSEEAFEHILSGRIDDARIAAFLSLIAARPAGPSVDEVAGAANVFRRHAKPVSRPVSGPFADARLLDTCGTGGAAKLFNVSTAAALVVPSASRGRVMVAKHGNTSRSGRGSVEVLRGLGVNVDAEAGVQTRCLGEAGVCFSMAPRHHPAARHAAAARKSLGFSTIFNLVGPLANPAGAEHQIIGTWSHANARLLAEALARLNSASPGSWRSWVYSSMDGLDELTITDRTLVCEVGSGRIMTHAFEIDAREYGLARADVGELRCDSLDEAVATVRRVLDRSAGPQRDMVLLSVGAALVVCGCESDLRSGITAAAGAIDRGEASATLERLVELTRSAA